MVKSKALDGGKLQVYSTKLSPRTKDELDALARVSGNGGQRVLIEEMVQLYRAAHPDVAERADAFLKLLGHDMEQAAGSEFVTLGTLSGRFRSDVPSVAAAPQAEPEVTQAPRLVKTVKYVGRPQLHLYEPGRKNSTGCGLAGTIDPETIGESSPEEVDCKKCRYCRKEVFE